MIVNADDFGMSPGVNRGIIRAHEQGIVTSASLMVRWPAAPDAANYARSHSSLSLGLHIDLGEWTCEDDVWRPLYEVVPLDEREVVTEEVERQLATFKQLMGRNPTHLDSHQHVHRRDPLRSVLLEAADRLAVPLRQCSSGIQYSGHFYGQTGKGGPLPGAISREGLLNILGQLPAGITELGCHPGEDDNLSTMYRAERRQEVAVLCDASVREELRAQNIQLCSFLDVRRSQGEWDIG